MTRNRRAKVEHKRKKLVNKIGSQWGNNLSIGGHTSKALRSLVVKMAWLVGRFVGGNRHYRPFSLERITRRYDEIKPNSGIIKWNPGRENNMRKKAADADGVGASFGNLHIVRRWRPFHLLHIYRVDEGDFYWIFSSAWKIDDRTPDTYVLILHSSFERQEWILYNPSTVQGSFVGILDRNFFVGTFIKFLLLFYYPGSDESTFQKAQSRQILHVTRIKILLHVLYAPKLTKIN